MNQSFPSAWTVSLASRIPSLTSHHHSTLNQPEVIQVNYIGQVFIAYHQPRDRISPDAVLRGIVSVVLLHVWHEADSHQRYWADGMHICVLDWAGDVLGIPYMREVESSGGSICNFAAGQSTEWGSSCYIKMLSPKRGDGIFSHVLCHTR